MLLYEDLTVIWNFTILTLNGDNFIPIKLCTNGFQCWTPLGSDYRL